MPLRQSTSVLIRNGAWTWQGKVGGQAHEYRGLEGPVTPVANFFLLLVNSACSEAPSVKVALLVQPSIILLVAHNSASTGPIRGDKCVQLGQ